MQTLSQISKNFNEYINQQLFDKEPSELYEPISYILALGGKRVRPLLAVAAYQLFSDEVAKSYPCAFAVEVFHNFTLMHDDIMDAAPLRRGKPTVHTKYNVSTGILSGDAMLILAYDYLMSVSEETKTVTKLIKIFNKVAIEVCEGQQFDMNFENRNDVSIEEYINMIRLKTAVLLGAALQMGAVAAGADEKNAQNIYDFGINIGISFQIQDDILDTYGDPETFGKRIGGDIVQNKKTFLYLKSLEILDENNSKKLFNLYNSSEKDEDLKIEAVKNLFDLAEIKRRAELLQEEYYQKGMKYLEAINVAEERKAPLKNIVAELMSRKV